MLLDELTNGPLAAEIAPHIAAGNDGVIWEILNRKDIPALGLVSNTDFMEWAAASGQRSVIEDTANNINDPLRSVALALLDMIRGTSALDLNRPKVKLMAEGWHAAGKMSLADKEELFSLGTASTSRAEQLGIQPSVGDIAQALRG